MKPNSLSTDYCTRAEVYRKAALLMERAGPLTDYPCWCISRIEKTDLHDWRVSPSVRPFLAAFSDETYISLRSGEYLDLMHDSVSLKQERDFDILALCFMAAMVEAGDA